MAELYQILLNAPGCSGRGVRYRVLPPSETDQVQIDAAVMCPPTSDPMRFRLTVFGLGIKRMLTEITRQGGYAHDDDLNSEEVQWVKINQQMLEPGPSEWAYDKVFTSVDDSIMSRVWNRATEVNPVVAEQIMGKARKVSSG